MNLLFNKKILLNIKKNIFYIFLLIAIISSISLYIVGVTTVKYKFDITLDLKSKFTKEINLMHLNRTLFGEKSTSLSTIPEMLKLDNLFTEFGKSIEINVQKKVGCMTFLKKSYSAASNIINIQCKTTDKKEKFLIETLSLIIEENEKSYINRFNYIVDIYLYSFGVADFNKENFDFFYIRNIADYEIDIKRIDYLKSVTLNSLLISSSLSLLIYLTLSLILNIYYRD